MQMSSLNSEPEFFTTKELAAMLDVTADWLNHNRRSKHPMPYYRLGRRIIRYEKSEIMAWLNSKQLAFYSPEKVALLLKVSVDWLYKNRCHANAIAFVRIGRLIRYNRTVVMNYLKKSV